MLDRVTTQLAALVLASALLHASWNAMIKGKTGDPLAASTGLAIAWALLGAPAVFFVPAPSSEAWPFLMTSVIVHVVYFGLLVAAYREGDLSFVYTIVRGIPPALVALFAFVAAEEIPSLLGLAGVALIASGVLALGGGSPLAVRSRRATWLALATALTVATYTVLDGLGARASGEPFGYLLWLTTAQGALFAGIALAVHGRTLIAEVRERWMLGLLTGVLSAAGYGIVIWAMTEAPIALVAALRETSVLFAAVLGALLLREPFGGRRIAAALLVAAGAALVRFGGR